MLSTKHFEYQKNPPTLFAYKSDLSNVDKGFITSVNKNFEKGLLIQSHVTGKKMHFLLHEFEFEEGTNKIQSWILNSRSKDNKLITIIIYNK